MFKACLHMPKHVLNMCEHPKLCFKRVKEHRGVFEACLGTLRPVLSTFRCAQACLGMRKHVFRMFRHTKACSKRVEACSKHAEACLGVF